MVVLLGVTIFQKLNDILLIESTTETLGLLIDAEFLTIVSKMEISHHHKLMR